MIANLEVDFTYGADPASPTAVGIALEAETEQETAQAMISASWVQAENFVRRSYRETLTGSAVIKVSSEMPYRWPRYPYPAALTIEVLIDGVWVPHSETYSPGLGIIELVPWTVYRLTQTAPIPACPIGVHVIQAVNNLALYQLIHGPARREFKSQQAGDSSLIREQVMGLFYGSGAGALLASEVRQ